MLTDDEKQLIEKASSTLRELVAHDVQQGNEWPPTVGLICRVDPVTGEPIAGPDRLIVMIGVPTPEGYAVLAQRALTIAIAADAVAAIVTSTGMSLSVPAGTDLTTISVLDHPDRELQIQQTIQRAEGDSTRWRCTVALDQGRGILGPWRRGEGRLGGLFAVLPHRPVSPVYVEAARAAARMMEIERVGDQLRAPAVARA